MHNLVNVRDFSGSKIGEDWAPAFREAIAAAVADGRGGVFVPSDPKPYTVRRPSDRPMSIDLRQRSNFMLAGEGDGSVIKLIGTGDGGAWSLIHVGGHSENIIVRDLFLDGNRTELDDLDEHTHLIRIGASATITGGAQNVKILNCMLARAHGDGIAILPRGDVADGITGGGEMVSNVQVAFCSFVDNHRSGISNQRFTEQIQILYNYFERTRDQDIDFEPSGGTLESGPRGYLIIGNVFVHSSPAPSVTLSGVGASIPALNNTFAYNQIYGGQLGMIDAQDTSIIGNYIEDGVSGSRTVVRLAGHLRGIRFAGNHIVRPAGAIPGPILAVSSRPYDVHFASQPINAASDEFGYPNHGFNSGDGPVHVTTSGTLPTGLALKTNYWVIRVNANVLQLAISEADAMAGKAIDITDIGVGIQTLAPITGPPRRRRFVSGGDIAAATDEFMNTNHGLATGAGPVRVITTGTLPTGLDVNTDYWVIRVNADVLKLATTRAHAMNASALEIADPGMGIQTVRLVTYPRGVDVHDNRFHSHVGSGNAPALVTFTNAYESSFRNNEVQSYSGGVISRALRFETSAAIAGDVRGWDVVGNRFRGDASEDEAGDFTSAITFSAAGVGVADIRICFNSFRGCTNQISWNTGSGGQFLTVPMAMGNNGEGVPHAGGLSAGVKAILIGGNDVQLNAPTPSTSTAFYCGSGPPGIAAPLGSIYAQTDGSLGKLLYVNTDGQTSWSGFA